MRASAACLGVSNCFCADDAAAASAFDAGAACKARPNKQEIAIAEAIREIFAEVMIFNFDFILVFPHRLICLSSAPASSSASSATATTAATTAHSTAAAPAAAVSAASHAMT